jgi:hypothetical protein
MANSLSIEVPLISNSLAMRIYDTSLWDDDVTVSSISLDIIPPGYTDSVTFAESKGFDRLFNASNLGITTVIDPTSMGALPDGIYIIRITADADWVEYNHLRQTCLLKDYYKALCSLKLDPCDTIDKNIEAKRRELMQIKSYIDAAKAKVEWCNAPGEGIELHNFAKKQLSNFSLSASPCKSCK